MSNKPRRNDPCPCGSQKKFKKCCGRPGVSRQNGARAAELAAIDADDPDPAIGRGFSDAERDHATVQVFKFARSKHESTMDQAHEEFWGGLDGVYGPRDLGAADMENLEMCFLDYWVYDYDLGHDLGRGRGRGRRRRRGDEGRREDGDGDTIVARFLRRRGGHLTRGERLFVELNRRQTVSLYEARHIEPGRGMVLADLLDGGRQYPVRERRGSHQLAPFQLLTGRLGMREDGDWTILGPMLTFPPGEAPGLLAEVEASLGPLEELDLEDKRILPAVFAEYYVEYSVGQGRPPKLVNMEGHELVWCTARWHVGDRERVAAALASHPEIEVVEVVDTGEVDRDDDHDHEREFRWFLPADAQVTPPAQLPSRVPGRVAEMEQPTWTRGTFRLARDELILEANSEERLAAARRLVKGLCGEVTEYQAVERRELGKKLREAAIEDESETERPPDDAEIDPEIDPEVERELTSRLLDGHYRKWPDMGLPALDGLTPRQASRLDSHRHRVVALLKDFEFSQQRPEAEARASVRPRYDFRWLWNELGLTHPDREAERWAHEGEAGS